MVYAGVEPLSSGIKSQFYSLEWCSPHASRLVGTNANTPVCRTGVFQNVGGVAKITYNGASFPAGNVATQMDVSALIPATRTSLTAGSATPALVSFFSGITNGAFSLEGEGVL